MPRRPRYNIDETELLRLYELERLSQYEIAQQLGITRATVRNRLRRLLKPSQRETEGAVSTEDIPAVDAATPQLGRTQGNRPQRLFSTRKEYQALRELLAWWQERTAAMERASDASRQTERITFHVEQRWREAIRSKSDLDGMTLTQIVNEAFRQYFER
jgi:DNA-binding Lrp family transcriptional regulator